MAHPAAWMALVVALAWPVAALADAEEGRDLFQEKGCAGCHMIDGDGGDGGPDLSNEGTMAGRDRQWHIRHLLDPAAVVPGSIMPKLVFDRDEAAHLADFLMSLGTADGVPSSEGK